MKKSILLLSMVLTLAACSSDDARKDENSLPPGIMQPVEGTGAIAGGSWITLAVLTACSSDSPAPVESADGTLSPGMMQPVDSPSMGGNATWEPQIQQSSVPNSMNTPMPQAPAQSAPQPNFQPTYQPQPVQKPQPAPISRFRAIQPPTHRITAKLTKASTKVTLTPCAKAIPCFLSHTFPVWM